VVDLIPKYYRTPRTIPVIDSEGKRSYVKINDPSGQGIQFNYDENALQVKVEAGVNFSIAKNKALQQIIALMNASPQFAEFINEAGLETLLDNIEFRNIDVLKSKVEQWLIKKQQQPNPENMKAQLAQQQMQMEEGFKKMEMALESQKLELAKQKMALEGEKAQADTMLKTEQIVVDKAKVDNDRLEIMQKAGESKAEIIVGIAKAHAEEERARADMHLSAHDQGHAQAMETLKHDLEVDEHEHQKAERKKEKENDREKVDTKSNT
jgi:predicted acyl esterase